MPILVDTYLEREVFDQASFRHTITFSRLVGEAMLRRDVNPGDDEEIERIRTGVETRMKDDAGLLATVAREERQRHETALNELDLVAAMILAVTWSGTNNQSGWAQDRVKLQTVAVTLLREQLYVATNGLSWNDVIFNDEQEVPVGLVRGRKKPELVRERLRLAGPRTPAQRAPETPNAFYTGVTARAFAISERFRTKPRVRVIGRTHSAYDAELDYDQRSVRLIFRTQLRIREALRANGETRQLVFITPPIGGKLTSFHAEMQLVDEIHKARERFDNKLIGVSKPCCILCARALDDLRIGYSTFSTFQPEGGRWDKPDAIKAREAREAELATDT